MNLSARHCLVILAFLFVWSNNLEAAPRITAIIPLNSEELQLGQDQGQPAEPGQPIVGFSIIFSESVYGFSKNDIATNGRVLALDGRNRNYRLVVAPAQNILSIEVLTDSARNLRGEGNLPLAGGPLLYDVENKRIISGNVQFSTIPNLAPPPAPEQPVPQPPVEPIEQPAPVEPAAPSPPPVVERRENLGPRSTARFLFNAGYMLYAPNFINTAQQTTATRKTAFEINAGFETISYFPRTDIFKAGFYTTIGYYRADYMGSAVVRAGDPSRATRANYQAAPLEFGAGFHIGEFLSLRAGAITHLGGTYIHQGYFTGSDGNTNNNANIRARLAEGAFGGTVSLSLGYRFLAVTVKYTGISLNNFTDETRNFGLPSNPRYRTLNSMNSLGIFVTFNS